MVLVVVGHKFHYEMENLCRIFFPGENIKVIYEDLENTENEIIIKTKMCEVDKDCLKISVGIFNGEISNKLNYTVSKNQDNIDIELKMAVLLFELLSSFTNYTPKWGVLTGVRPSKLMTKLVSTMGEENAKEYFENSLLVNPQKTNLALQVAKKEQLIIEKSNPNSFSLYVSIPFCPTRCSYCSFVSHSINSSSAKKLLPQYLDLLCDEIKLTAKIANEIGLNLETIYIGGGTPSILDENQIKRILKEICDNFNIKSLKEFTFEAGRPDTIDEEKLQAIKQFPVSRISINPQSFNDDVLKEIGRNHLADQTIFAYYLAKSLDFNDINMDIIAGLPKDDIQSFKNTLETLLELSPSSITVHTLAIKKSSKIAVDEFATKQSEITCEMVELAEEMLSKNKYTPYYMYRQSKSLGNLENVGWCKEGFEGYYNIFMMEECHTVLAVGAGAVTKLKEPHGNYIERIFNYKYPYEYINQFETIIDRKNKIYNFYELYKIGG